MNSHQRRKARRACARWLSTISPTSEPWPVWRKCLALQRLSPRRRPLSIPAMRQLCGVLMAWMGWADTTVVISKIAGVPHDVQPFLPGFEIAQNLLSGSLLCPIQGMWRHELRTPVVLAGGSNVGIEVYAAYRPRPEKVQVLLETCPLQASPDDDVERMKISVYFDGHSSVECTRKKSVGISLIPVPMQLRALCLHSPRDVTWENYQRSRSA